MGNPALVRAQAAFGAAFAAEWAFTVALGLVAYAEGGATAVGLVGVLRLVPSALLAPVISSYADRMARERVLAVSSLLRGAATLAAAGVLAANGPAAIVYVLAVPSTVAFVPFRAAHSALLPSLARSAEELTRAIVVRGGLDSLSLAVGPFAAALLVAIFDVWTVFAAAGAAAVLAALLTTRLSYERVAREPVTVRPSLVAETRDGLRAVRDNGGIALVFAVGTLQALVRGGSTVFVVVVAIDLLGRSESWVGWLQGAMGVGAVLGSLAATRLIASRALARWLAVGVWLWSLPFALIGGVPLEVVALLALAIVGVGNAIVDVAAFAVPGRLAEDEVLARVFGVLESLVAAGVAAGALLAPLAIALTSLEAALLIFGVGATAVAALAWRRLRRIDESLAARTEDIRLLRQVPMLRPLAVHAMDQIARNLERVEVAAGEMVFAAGDVGDTFYVVEAGRVEFVDRGERLGEGGPGEGFGEIALLRDVPRTVSVRACEPTLLCAIRRADFLAAVTGFADARAAAEAAMARYRRSRPDAGGLAVAGGGPAFSPEGGRGRTRAPLR